MAISRPNRVSLSLTISLALLFACLSGGGELLAREKPERVPDWKLVEAFVHRYFRGQGDYQEGDLISRGHVRTILSHLKKMGWTAPDALEIQKATIADTHVIVQQLNTSQGVKFMRKANRDPMLYSKLDRISRKYGGPALIRDLVRLPDGAKYAASKRTPGVPTMVELLPRMKRSRPQKVDDFDKPTGDIYTEKQLLERLKESYDKSMKQQS